MNTAQIDDLKQFIDARLSQWGTSIEDRLDKKIDELREEMHAGFASIAEIIDRHNDTLDNHHRRLVGLDSRVTKLENRPA